MPLDEKDSLVTTTTRTQLPTYAAFRDLLAGTPPTTTQLKEHFAPTFDAITQGTKEREKDRELGFEAVELLRESGFTRAHLPWADGGLHCSIEQLIDLYIDLGTADSNLAQGLHSHFLFTQIVANRDHGPITRWILDETAAGKIFGNAIVELPPATGYRKTTVEQNNELNGDKFYTTGALFSDHLLVSAHNPVDETQLLYAVPANHSGVRRVDDWNGFGQRLTASGSTLFHDVPVHPDRSLSIATPSGMLGYPFVWLMLAATQVGIGIAALRDITAYVQGRRRTYAHATAETPAQDPLVHHVAGEVSAKVHTARYIALGAAQELQAAFNAVRSEDSLDSEIFRQAHTAANLAVTRATIVISEQIIAATNQIFETGGASAVTAEKQLHQHWLNARVIGSQSPLIYRIRMIGDYHLNGVIPPLVTSVRDSAPQNDNAAEGA